MRETGDGQSKLVIVESEVVSVTVEIWVIMERTQNLIEKGCRSQGLILQPRCTQSKLNEVFIN